MRMRMCRSGQNSWNVIRLWKNDSNAIDTMMYFCVYVFENERDD
jgi:hypothetical protein